MPGNGAFLVLDLTTRRALCVVLEDLEPLAHPAHIQLLRGVAAPLRTRFPNEATMLRRHSQVRDVSRMLLKELAIAPREDIQVIAWSGRERLEHAA